MRVVLLVANLVLLLPCSTRGGSSAGGWSGPRPLASPTNAAGSSGDVDVEALMERAWACRSDSSSVPELGRQLAKLLQAEVIDERVEEFLPQIAHLIVALPAGNPAASLLERFALLVCERNVHIALTLSWAVYASLEDNAPDRPRADVRVYARCARLLAHIEQSVVYGARLRYTTRREALRDNIGRAARAIAGHAAALTGSGGSLAGPEDSGVCRPTDFPPLSAGASDALQRDVLTFGERDVEWDDERAAQTGAGSEGATTPGSRARALVPARSEPGADARGSPPAPSLRGVLWLIVGKPSAWHASSLLGLSREGFRTHEAWLSESTLFFRRTRISSRASPALSPQPPDPLLRWEVDGAIPLAHAAVELRTSTRGYTYLFVGARFSRRELRLRPTLSGRAGLEQLLAWRDALLRAAGSGVHDDDVLAAGGRQGRGLLGRARSGLTVGRWLGRQLGRVRLSPAGWRLSGAASAPSLAPRLAASASAPGEGGGLSGSGGLSGGSSRQLALSAAQQRTHRFLLQQRDLVHALCSLAEELFGAAQPALELVARLDALALPEVAYLPTCRSADAFERVVRLPAEEAVVFVTQSRASVMLFAEVLGSSSGRSVARLFEPTALGGAPTAAQLTPPRAVSSSQPHEGEGAPLGAGGVRRALLAPTAVARSAARAPLALARSVLWRARALEMPTPSSPVLLPEQPQPAGSSRQARAGAGAVPPAGGLGAGSGRHRLDEAWEDKCRRIRESSPRGGSPRWALRSVLCKANDDVRQEAFVMQLLEVLHRAFPDPLRLRPYRVLATGRACGLIEAVVGARSLDHVKKRRALGSDSLPAIFESRWGSDAATLLRARTHFLHSLAAYSIACYVLQIRDRHNGNVLLCDDGSLVHIDFGFALGLAPGGRLGPETSAPFKLSAEMVAVLGGPESEWFTTEFPRLCTLALRAARTRAKTLLMLVEVMSLKPSLRCFVGAGNEPLRQLRARLMLDVPDEQLPARVQQLIDRSFDAFGPNAYDRYQRIRNGIRE